MDGLLSAVVLVGPLALLASFAAVLIYYLGYRDAPEPKRHPSVWLYVAVALGLGVAAYPIGTIIGISAACSSANAGNLCGFVGVFGVGPLLSAVAIFLYAHSWARNARRAP